jgi:hypothetical protein
MRRALFLLILLGCISQANAQVIFYVETPPPLVGNYEMTWADPGGGWGTPDLNNPANAILDTLVFVDDGTAADSLGCNAPINGAQLAGQIAVIYRGSCEFGVNKMPEQLVWLLSITFRGLLLQWVLVHKVPMLLFQQ